MSRFAALLAIAVLPWGVCAAGGPAAPAGDEPGGFVDRDGRTHDLAEFSGSLVVVNFWATWCLPCRDEMPLFVDLARRRAADGVVVVGAAADGLADAKEVDRFAADLGIGFPIWMEASIEDMARLGLGSALPATAVLDRDGRVVLRVNGVVDGPGLDAWIDWLLGDRASPAPPVPIDTGAGVERPGRHGHAHDEHGHDEHGHAHGPGVGLDGPSLVPS
ncbi:MAG TPA: redoxin domain-containing protein [Candidatus Binatia bacterium]|nr:redoxin domain-containing protein [Candidatus Binatia bacterium]